MRTHLLSIALTTLGAALCLTIGCSDESGTNSTSTSSSATIAIGARSLTSRRRSWT